MIRKGCSTVTMDDVAREAELSKATLYKYFPGKGQLVFEILVHFFEDIRTLLGEVQAGPGAPLEKFRRSLQTIMDFQREKENISRVLLTDESICKIFRVFSGQPAKAGSASQRKLLNILRQKRREVLETGAALIEEGIAAGAFRRVDVPAAVVFVDALLQGYDHYRAWFGPDGDASVEIDVLLDFVLRGIGGPASGNKET